MGKFNPKARPKSQRNKSIKIIVHLGPPKTGTTALQKFMLANKQNLIKKGVLYPGDEVNHYHFQTLFSETPHSLIQVQSSKEIYENIDEFKFNFKLDFEKELKSSGAKTVFISSEFFTSMSVSELTEFYAYLRGLSRNIEALYYVRNPISQCLSSTFQLIRNGRLSGNVNLIEEGVPSYEPPGGSILEFNEIFEGNLKLRYYDEKRESNFDIISDCIKYLDVSQDDLHMSSQRENRRLGLETIVLIAQLNQLIPQFDIDGNYISSASRDWMIETIIDSSIDSSDAFVDASLSESIYNLFSPSLEIIRNISPETYNSLKDALSNDQNGREINRISIDDISRDKLVDHMMRALKMMADRTFEQNRWAHHERDRMAAIKKDILDLIERH